MPAVRLGTLPAGVAVALDVGGLARLLRCSTAYVYKLCERGELPHLRDASNALRFDLGEILRKAFGVKSSANARSP